MMSHIFKASNGKKKKDIWLSPTSDLTSLEFMMEVFQVCVAGDSS